MEESLALIEGDVEEESRFGVAAYMGHLQLPDRLILAADDLPTSHHLDFGGTYGPSAIRWVFGSLLTTAPPRSVALSSPRSLPLVNSREVTPD